MEWKKVEKSAYETNNYKFDFHIRLEENNWIVDVFDMKIKDAKKSYLETFLTKTLKEAKLECENYV